VDRAVSPQLRAMERRQNRCMATVGDQVRAQNRRLRL